MNFVKPCCSKVNNYMQDELGRWKKTGKVGNMTIRSERHAENMVMQRALRDATTNGYMKPYGNYTYKG